MDALEAERGAGWTSDTTSALWNALKLGSSYLATWSVALGIRFVLPRVLGPASYGAYSFANAFALTAFVLASFGAETYIQKEIPLRTAHASDFFGSLVLLRAVTGLLIGLGIAVLLRWTHQPDEVAVTALVFAVGQFLFVNNDSLAAFLEAKGTVGGLSIANVVAKLAWGTGIGVALILRLDLWALAAVFALAEAIRGVVIFLLCRKHLALRVRIDPRAAYRVLRACIPFFVSGLAITLYDQIDDTLIGFLADAREVGWYGMATNIAQVALLMAPLLGSVLLPLLSRAKARSDEALEQLMRRSLEVVLVIALPVSLALGLGADVWIRWVGGAAFAPAGWALRLLSPIFILNYVGMMCADCLFLFGRSWRVTVICLGGLVINVALNALLIGPSLLRLGDGGAGVGAALATLGTELFTTTLLLREIGRRAFDGRLLSVLGRTALACTLVIAADRMLQSLGTLRLALDAAVYLGAVLAFGGIKPAEVRLLVKHLRASRAAPADRKG